MTNARRTVTCDRCHTTFEPQWSNEEALAEMRQRFGDIPTEDRATLCDECYARFLEWLDLAEKKQS